MSKCIEQCGESLGGNRCELTKGHKGHHNFPYWKNGKPVQLSQCGDPKGNSKKAGKKRVPYGVWVSWVSTGNGCKEKE